MMRPHLQTWTVFANHSRVNCLSRRKSHNVDKEPCVNSFPWSDCLKRGNIYARNSQWSDLWVFALAWNILFKVMPWMQCFAKIIYNYSEACQMNKRSHINLYHIVHKSPVNILYRILRYFYWLSTLYIDKLTNMIYSEIKLPIMFSNQWH